MTVFDLRLYRVKWDLSWRKNAAKFLNFSNMIYNISKFLSSRSCQTTFEIFTFPWLSCFTWHSPWHFITIWPSSDLLLTVTYFDKGFFFLKLLSWWILVCQTNTTPISGLTLSLTKILNVNNCLNRYETFSDYQQISE